MADKISGSETVQKLMFDYVDFSEADIIAMCAPLPKKVIRWMGINHPDNKARKIFFRLTGVEIGEGTVININFFVSDNYKPLLKIGKNCAISPNVTVICDSGPNNSSLNFNSYVKDKLIVADEVIIKDNVWLGAGVVILPGVTIGDGSIIGAGAVVSASVPDNVISAGVPAKVIRKL